MHQSCDPVIESTINILIQILTTYHAWNLRYWGDEPLRMLTYVRKLKRERG